MNEALDRLARDYWDFRMESSPTHALLLGDHRFDDQFEDTSRITEDHIISTLGRFATEATAIDPDGLTPDEKVTRDVLLFDAVSSARVQGNRAVEMAISHTVGFHTQLPVLIPQFPLTAPEHARAMPAKFRALAKFFDDWSTRLRDGVAAGRVSIRSTAEKVVPQADQLLAAEATASPLYQLPAPPDWAEESAWREEMAAVIDSELKPAIQRWRDTIAEEVIPNARPDDRPGLCHIPGGEEAYANTLYRFTTTDLTADQIHEIGLAQIAKLAEEYVEIAGPVLGTTDLDEIFTRMREDPELRYQSGPPMVEASVAAMEKAKAIMGDWFGRLPKADCMVTETPYGPAAYYYPPATDGSRPGTFFINTSDPSKWATYEMEALSYHEAIPGHHLQIAISSELEGVPDFRKHASNSAYAEGWGLYTERLADEMGLYSTPLDRIGMLSADSLRAGRLVVDTGIHAKGWTRQQAIDYFRDNSPMSIVGIEAEVDRYISMPGQACSYMIGRLEILRIREEAQRALGDRFDIKGFHDTVLGSGLVPLGTLDRMVQEWVAAQL